MHKGRLEAFTDGVIAVIITIMVLEMKAPPGTDFAALPTAAYGFVLVMAAIGYLLLERMLIACNGADSTLARAVGSDLKAKLSLSAYAVAIGLAFVQPWIALALYIAVALLWFVPDRRIEKII